MVAFPVFELVAYYSANNFNSDLLFFALSQVTALAVAAFFSFHFGLVFFDESKVSRSANIIDGTISKYFFLITLLFFIVFLYFVFQYLKSFSALVYFSEEYRNGYYSGTGLFTAGMTQVVPIFLALMLIKSPKLDVFFYCTLIMALVASYILGLRIYLLSICFYLIVRVFYAGVSFKSLLVIFFLAVFLVSFKLFLNESVREAGVVDILSHVLGRTSYRFLIYDTDFGLDVGLLNYFSCGLECFKEGVVSQIPDITNNMPFINKYSGVAIPLPMLLFNMFGYFGFVFVVIALLAFLFFFKGAYSGGNLFFNIFSTIMAFYFFAMLIEDVSYILKVDFALLLGFSIFILVRVLAFLRG